MSVRWKKSLDNFEFDLVSEIVVIDCHRPPEDEGGGAGENVEYGVGIVHPVDGGLPLEVLGSEGSYCEASESEQVVFRVGNFAEVDEDPNQPQTETHHYNSSAQ